MLTPGSRRDNGLQTVSFGHSNVRLLVPARDEAGVAWHRSPITGATWGGRALDSRCDLPQYASGRATASVEEVQL